MPITIVKHRPRQVILLQKKEIEVNTIFAKQPFQCER